MDENGCSVGPNGDGQLPIRPIHLPIYDGDGAQPYEPRDCKDNDGQTTTSWSRTTTAATTLAAQSVWKWHPEFRGHKYVDQYMHPSTTKFQSLDSDTTPGYMVWSELTTVLSISLVDRHNVLCRLSFHFSRYVVYWFFSMLSHISSLIRLYTTTYTCGSSTGKAADVQQWRNSSVGLLGLP